MRRRRQSQLGETGQGGVHDLIRIHLGRVHPERIVSGLHRRVPSTGVTRIALTKLIEHALFRYGLSERPELAKAPTRPNPDIRINPEFRLRLRGYDRPNVPTIKHRSTRTPGKVPLQAEEGGTHGSVGSDDRGGRADPRAAQIPVREFAQVKARREVRTRRPLRKVAPLAQRQSREAAIEETRIQMGKSVKLR